MSRRRLAAAAATTAPPLVLLAAAAPVPAQPTGADFSVGDVLSAPIPSGLTASPIADADEWRSPVLFVHGDDDRNVPSRRRCG